MSQILNIILAALAVVVAVIMKLSISLLILVTSRPADRKRRIENVNRNYDRMIRGAKMLIKK